MPDYLQLDNELSFRGSNRHPRSFGSLIRLALAERITPVFIPPAEPWRNGVIEKFNDNVQRYFLNTQNFSNLKELQDRAVEFMCFHNQNHRYSTLSGKTPGQIVSNAGSFKLANLPEAGQRIPMEEGEVVFVRFIRSDCRIKILDTQFEVKRELMYTYVIARIIIQKHILRNYSPFLGPLFDFS
jgi:putative transposase